MVTTDDGGADNEQVAERRTSEHRTGTARAALTISGVAALLSFGFFPELFSRLEIYDDEGYFLATLREFLRHGDLYSHVRTEYGPFYFSFMGAIFRLIGHTPSPFIGRLIVLFITAASVAMFGATVWHVTRSLAFSVLCEIVTFGILISVAGSEPMHPGSVIVLLLSLMVYGLAGYAMEPKTLHLMIVGASLGALLMTKVNVGGFAAVAVVVIFVVGNREFSDLVGALAAAAAALLPFALMVQMLAQPEIAEFALLVSISLVLLYIPMYVDAVVLPPRALAVVGASAVAVVIASWVWPLLSGTSPAALAQGVFLRPLRQANVFSYAAPIYIAWLPFIVTLSVLLAVLSRRRATDRMPFGPPWLPNAALGFAGIAVLGLGTIQSASGAFLTWLPAIVLLPALAWASRAPLQYRLALRFLVVVAILQILHAYPVAGSQRQWGLVAMVVPCAIAIAISMQQVPIWRQAAPAVRAFAIVALGLVFLLGAGLSPVSEWNGYSQLIALNLPGTDLIRVSPFQAHLLRALTGVVRSDCDTFYAAPGFDSLYIYTGLPAPTGLLASSPGALTTGEQHELAQQLAALHSRGKRVCILRDLSRAEEWHDSSYGNGPLGKALAAYQRPVTQVLGWTVSRYGPPSAPG